MSESSRKDAVRVLGKNADTELGVFILKLLKRMEDSSRIDLILWNPYSMNEVRSPEPGIEVNGGNHLEYHFCFMGISTIGESMFTGDYRPESPNDYVEDFLRIWCNRIDGEWKLTAEAGIVNMGRNTGPKPYERKELLISDEDKTMDEIIGMVRQHMTIMLDYEVKRMKKVWEMREGLGMI